MRTVFSIPRQAENMELVKLLHPFLLMLIIVKQFYCSYRMDLELKSCGYEPKCSINQTHIHRKDTSCCLECGCSDICLERNNCCRDKPGRSKGNIHSRQECVQAIYVPEGYSGEVLAESYYTRTRCPDAYDNNTVKERCESAFPDKFEELQFVSSEDGKLIYKNKFCGLCHGENRTIAWEMVVGIDRGKCRNAKAIPNDNAEEMTKFVISQCIINFSGPSNVDVRSVLCFDKSELVTRCNVTGTWDEYNSELKSMCINESSNVVVFPHRDHYTYSNPYCFLCNKPKIFPPCYGYYQKIRTEGLIKLINYEKWKSEDGPLIDGSMGLCRSDEILDTFFNRCRRLHCPIYTIPVNARCITFVDFGQCANLILRLEHNGYDIRSDALIRMLEPNVRKIQNKAGFKKCFVCSMKISLSLSNEKDIYIILCLQGTATCSNEYLWTKIIAIRRQGHLYASLKLNATRKLFELVTMNNVEAMIWKPIYRKYYGLPVCRSNDKEPELLCPKVKLTQAEYEAVVRTHVNADRLIYTTDDATNQTRFVCCNDYILTHASGSFQKKMSVILTVVKVVFLCTAFNV